MARRILAISVLAMCFGAIAAPANGQPLYGARVGFSADPDQFFIGGHVELPWLEKHPDLKFRPNVELGFGDDTTILAGNLEFVVVGTVRRSWAVYFGGGPALVFVNNDSGTDIHGGVNLLAGAQHERGFFGELKFGGGFSPGLKVMAGYVFKMR